MLGKRQVAVTSIVLFLVVGVAGPSLAQRSSRLTGKQEAMLRERVAPAYHLDNPLLLAESLGELVSKLDDTRLKLVDRWLESQAIPPSGSLLADARLKLVHLNQSHLLPTPHPREAVVALSAIKQRVDATLADLGRHPIMRDPLPCPDKLADYQPIFWEVHVLENRLANAAHAVRHAAELAAAAKNLTTTRIGEEGQRLLATDFAALSLEVEQRDRELEEREAELRIQRVERSAKVLNESADGGERFLAAYVLDLDGDLLVRFFEERAKDPAIPFVRPQLADSNVRDRIRATVETGRIAAGDLMAKAELLYTGLHWWLRGRYGAGPQAYGLLKDRRALVSEQAQFPLYMPMATPQPTDPLRVTSKVPTVERRHHYTWAVEYRPIISSVNVSQSSTTTTQFVGTKTTAHLSHFY